MTDQRGPHLDDALGAVLNGYAWLPGLLRRGGASSVQIRVEYQLTVSEETAQEPYRTPADHPAVAVLAAAMGDGFGRPVGRMANAGGGPAELLARKLDAPVLFFGTGLPEDRWHDSDESVAVDVLLAGAATLAHFWSRLAGGAPGGAGR